MTEKAQINILRWLFHIDIFNESTIEEFIIDIKLLKMPFVGHSNGKHNKNNGSLDNVTKSVSGVKIRYLSIAFGNKSGFETFNRAIKYIFGAKHLFGSHNIGVGMSMHKSLYAILLKGLNFFIYSNKPNWIFGRRLEAFQLKRGKESIKKLK